MYGSGAKIGTTILSSTEAYVEAVGFAMQNVAMFHFAPTTTRASEATILGFGWYYRCNYQKFPVITEKIKTPYIR